jgi:hypothetical protein
VQERQEFEYSENIPVPFIVTTKWSLPVLDPEHAVLENSEACVNPLCAGLSTDSLELLTQKALLIGRFHPFIGHKGP